MASPEPTGPGSFDPLRGDTHGEERPHKPRGYSLAPYLLLVGLLFLFMAFVAPVLEFVETHFGFRRLASASLGFLFLYVAWVAREHGRFRERVLDMVEGVLRIFYGSNFRQERQAIDILVNAMESETDSVRQNARQHLLRLTGEDFGADASAWSDWWAANRATFRSPAAKNDTPGVRNGQGES